MDWCLRTISSTPQERMAIALRIARESVHMRNFDQFTPEEQTNIERVRLACLAADAEYRREVERVQAEGRNEATANTLDRAKKRLVLLREQHQMAVARAYALRQERERIHYRRLPREK